ncbi:glycosyltransferase [Methylobacterium nigriterrae]|uniref:glycosyltransferase n=1 Tax=Methylobacterium nigriterrae TaxID=3127512 RepID=UPI003013CB9B
MPIRVRRSPAAAAVARLAAPAAAKRRARLRAAECERVARSGLFDAAWYLERYEDVRTAGLDPLRHFCLWGAREGRWPHPLFHADWYLAAYPDVEAAGANPLLHYLDHGVGEGRRPNPLFDPTWYARANSGDAEAAADPLVHYARHGGTRLSPSENFDLAGYLAENRDAVPAGMSALEHRFRQTQAGDTDGAGRMPDRALRRTMEIIRESGLFDAAWYAARYPEAVTGTGDALRHFVTRGAAAGHRPNPVFDTDWYTRSYPESVRAGMNPLRHYIARGLASDLRPSPLFDPAWYRASYPDAAAVPPSRGGLLRHFLDQGGARTSPSVHFDALRYEPAEEASPGLDNPLAHYVERGRSEGRAVRSLDPAFETRRRAAGARMVCLRRAEAFADEAALLVTHAPNGLIKGHVEPYAAALAAAGIDVVLVVAADQASTGIPRSLLDRCSAVYLRENAGFDFAAWAHVLQEEERLSDSAILYLLNDSLLGPAPGPDFPRLLDRIRASDDDIVAATDSHEHGWHLQSFFLAVKRRALSSWALQGFLHDIAVLDDKTEVIERYELAFASRMRAAGLRCRALFPSAPGDGNRSMFAWRSLTEQGFPFIKASLVAGAYADLGGEAAKAWVAAQGIDRTARDAAVRSDPKVWGRLEPVAAAPREPIRVGFYGPWNVASGLGAASRSYVSALRRTGLACAFHPVKPPWGTHQRTAPSCTARDFAGPPDVALVHLNPEAWDVMLTGGQRQEIGAATRRVGLYVWETSIVPDHWMRGLSEVDAILAPSTFCADIFRQYTDRPIDVVPYVVEPERPDPISRAAAKRLRRTFGLDPDRRIVLYIFDGSSYLARKNPYALIRAFRAAGLARRGWQLVLKTKHIFHVRSEGEALTRLVGEEHDTVLIDRPLTRDQLETLLGLADIYASPHSSEGFGLTIAEAMAFGKVVVATDYGGSRDVLDAACGFPVRATVTMLGEDNGPYRSGSLWGEVDEAELARALAAAAEAAAGPGDLGRAAAGRIRAQLSAETVGRSLERHVRALFA